MPQDVTLPINQIQQTIHSLRDSVSIHIIYSCYLDTQNFQATFHCQPTQPAITCSKLTIETLEQGVKYVQS